VLGNFWPWSGGHAQYVRWAQQPNGTAPAVCNPAGGPGRVPNLADARWRAHGFENLPYPGPGTAGWGDWMQVAGQFYTLPAAQALWRRHVRFMLTRVNRYTGVSVADDPTVAILELANEPRPKGGAPLWRADLAPFVSWLASAAAFVKSLAPSQLVASGAEGDTQRLSLGQAALLTQNGSGIDVVTVHAWPMNFNWLVRARIAHTHAACVR
jgi:mannan endo-1,4-beta-mannosidase